mmetsp:Transcript_27189/g.74984  ORF Transcript_27189/g.74984 Transcript_27189/m.74984 type:complete len:235 (+) Transcript_27189:526-1230(+)
MKTRLELANRLSEKNLYLAVLWKARTDDWESRLVRERVEHALELLVKKTSLAMQFSEEFFAGDFNRWRRQSTLLIFPLPCNDFISVKRLNDSIFWKIGAIRPFKILFMRANDSLDDLFPREPVELQSVYGMPLGLCNFEHAMSSLGIRQSPSQESATLLCHHRRFSLSWGLDLSPSPSSELAVTGSTTEVDWRLSVVASLAPLSLSVALSSASPCRKLQQGFELTWLSSKASRY